MNLHDFPPSSSRIADDYRRWIDNERERLSWALRRQTIERELFIDQIVFDPTQPIGVYVTTTGGTTNTVAYDGGTSSRAWRLNLGVGDTNVR